MFPDSAHVPILLPPVVNLTGVGPDYVLAIGQVAKITYAAATVVPLRIATEEGLYEIDIMGNEDVTIGTAGMTLLARNNVTVTAGDIDTGYIYIPITSNVTGAATITGYSDCTTLTSFYLCWNLLVRAVIRISTITKCKTLSNKFIRRDSATAFYIFDYTENWLNTVTAWASLGTITFPFAQSGIIVIRRII